MKKISIALIGISLFVASCSTGINREQEAKLAEQQKTIDDLKMEMVKQRVIDSMAQVAAMAATPVAEPVETVTVVRPKKKKTVRYANYEPVSENTTGTYTGYSNNNSNTAVSETPVATPPIVYQEPQQQQKKGWSAKAKGAAIGAAAGAIGGAVVHKKQRGVGAVVGGILGAGAGLGIGAVIDKKQGR